MSAGTAYPLTWPAGWKRTPVESRSVGRFGTTKTNVMSGWRHTEHISIHAATVRLRQELGRMGVRDDDIVLSTNLQLRLDGLPRSGQTQPKDPGAAVYWSDPWAKAPRCMAIDRYTKVEQNIAALAATIEAMRAIERHGGAAVLERAFSGFIAVPAPAAEHDWRVVLELQDVVELGREDVERAFRRLAAKAHPDRDGSHERMTALNLARERALAWVEGRRRASGADMEGAAA